MDSGWRHESCEMVHVDTYFENSPKKYFFKLKKYHFLFFTLLLFI